MEAPAAEQTSIMPEAGYISDEDTSALLLAEPDVDAEGDGFDSPGPTPERLHAPRVPLRVGRLARQQPGISSPPPLLLRGGFSSASANALSPPTFNRGGQSSQSPQSPSKKPGSRPDEQTLGTKVSKHGLVGPCRKLGAGGKASHKTAYSRVKYMPGVGDSSRFPVNGLAMWNTGTAYNCRGSAHDQDESDPDEDEDDYHQAMLDGGELDTIDSITSPSVDGRRTLSSFGHASEADDTPATTPRSPESTCELPPEHEETAAKASPLGSSGEKPDDSRSSSEPFPKAGGEKAAGKSERNTVFAHALPTSMSMSLQRTPAHAGALTLSLPYDATAGLSPRVHFSDAERQQNGLFTTPIVERRRHVSASSFNLERLPAGPGADEGPGTPSSSSKGPVGLALMGTSPLFSPCHALELGSRLSRPSSPFAMAGLPPVQSPAPLVLPPSQHLQKEVRIKEEEAEALCATANEQRGPKQLPTGRPSTGSSKLANSLLASTTESSVFAVKQEPADCPNFSTSRSSSLDSFGRDSSWFDRSCSPCSDASDVDDACFDMLPPETMGLNELDRAWDPVDVDYDSLTGDDHAKVGIELKSSVAGQPMDVDDDASARSKLKDGGDPDLRPAKMPRRSTRAR